MPSFGKRTPLTAEHFKDFEKAFENNPFGKSERTDQGEEGRFRCLRASRLPRADNLDISWLRDENATRTEDLPEPDKIASQIMEKLRTAMEEMEALTAVLEGKEVKA